MRRFFWHRWTLIFLLMARLVIGEWGHAMPVAAMSPLQHATLEVAVDPACAEHDGAATAHPGEISDQSSTYTGDEHDCCQSGDCECPCLQMPCAALGAAVMSPVSIALLRIPHASNSVTSLRPSGLFRPPA